MMNNSKFVEWLFDSKTGQSFIVLNGFFVLLILKLFVDLVKDIPITFNAGQIAFVIIFVVFDIIFYLDFLNHKRENKQLN